MERDPTTHSSKLGSRARVVVQQCTAARVKSSVVAGDPVQFLEIKEGMVVYVCFLKECTKEVLSKIVRAVLYVRYLRAKDGKRVSVLELPGDVLIVPQSTLGGIRKKRHVSYNYNINKAEACELYREFVEMCQREVMSTEETTCHVRGGNYDNKYEDMHIETGRVGLMTHVLDF